VACTPSTNTVASTELGMGHAGTGAPAAEAYAAEATHDGLTAGWPYGTGSGAAMALGLYGSGAAIAPL